MNTVKPARPLKDEALGAEARQAVMAFFNRPALQALTGGHTVTKVTDKEEDITCGDIRLDFHNGSVRHIEVKHVNHTLGTPNAPESTPFAPQNSRTLPTTIFEALKGRDFDRPLLNDWKWTFMQAFNLTATQAGQIRVTTNTGRVTTLKDYPLHQQHLNTKPFANGSIAAYMHLPTGHLMLDDGRDLLDRARTAMLKRGLYDSPGFAEKDTMLIRHIPYSKYRFIRDLNGGWWPTSDHAEARENLKNLIIPTVSSQAA